MGQPGNHPQNSFSRCGSGLVGLAWSRQKKQSRTLAENRPGPMRVSLAEFTDSGEKKGVIMMEKVIKTEEEWMQMLTPQQFEVTRRKGTEPPFTGTYDKLYEEGIYRCVCCGNALFSSKTKFKSGTGWPSFWEPIAKENVRIETDMSYGMARTEILCKKCDAHLGHVFEDGPDPTGLRYCINSVALNLAKKENPET